MRRLEVVAGTLELLLLKTLSRGEPMHGFELLNWIKETTDGALILEEGALYPALHRLERRKLIKAQWEISEKGRRAKYYTMTGAGRQELVREEAQWLGYLEAWRKIALSAAR
jgi:transcriptional regulator